MTPHMENESENENRYRDASENQGVWGISAFPTAVLLFLIRHDKHATRNPPKAARPVKSFYCHFCNNS
jgi:hypothetical protein